MVLPRHRKVILVHGCFWHGHRACKRGRQPSSNTQFWKVKLAANLERDRRVISSLVASGWRVLVVWGCEISNPYFLESRLRRFLSHDA